MKTYDCLGLPQETNEEDSIRLDSEGRKFIAPFVFRGEQGFNVINNGKTELSALHRVVKLDFDNSLGLCLITSDGGVYAYELHSNISSKNLADFINDAAREEFEVMTRKGVDLPQEKIWTISETGKLQFLGEEMQSVVSLGCEPSLAVVKTGSHWYMYRVKREQNKIVIYQIGK